MNDHQLFFSIRDKITIKQKGNEWIMFKTKRKIHT